MTTRSLPLPSLSSVYTTQNTATNIGSAVIIANANETGPGVTATGGVGGLQVYRGPTVPPAQLYWNETLNAWTAGLSTNAAPIALVAPGSMGVLTYNGSLFVNGSPFLNTINQNVSTSASPSFQDLSINGSIISGSAQFTIPTSDGTPGQILTTQGGNQGLVWSSASVSSGGNFISNTSGDTSVTTQNGIIDNHTITITAGGTPTIVSTATGTIIPAPLQMQSSTSLNPTNVTSANYSIQPNDNLVIYTGSANTIFTLPSGVSNKGRQLIIENLTDYSVTITPHSGDTLEGGIGSEILDQKFNNTFIVSDGTGNWLFI